MSFDLEFCSSGAQKFECIEDVVDAISYAFDGNTSGGILELMTGIIPDIQSAGFNLYRIGDHKGSSLPDTGSASEILYIEEAANEENRVYIHILLENPYRVTLVTREVPKDLDERGKGEE